ncbi:MAG: hypothetical protein Q9166_000925 [cf. Caloplaca sp. 2 TL-2023]
MKYSVAAIFSASLAGLVAAQGCNQKVDPNKQSGNPVRAPLTEIVPVGTPYTIRWDATTKDKPVSIELLRGPAENILPIQCLANGIPNTGTFSWTPDTTLTADVTRYGLRIIVADGSGQFQYSNQFGISNDVVHSSTLSSLSASTRPTRYISSSSYLSTATGSVSVFASSIAANTTTATVPIVTGSSNTSSVVVIATTHLPIPVPSTGAVHSTTILQPTNNMTVPASLRTSKTQRPTSIIATGTGSATSVNTGTGSPIAGPGTVPSDSGAGKVLAGSMLTALVAMAVFLP